jgi:hypothetical protein
MDQSNPPQPGGAAVPPSDTPTPRTPFLGRWAVLDQPQRASAYVCIGFAIVACIEQVRLLVDLVGRYANEDHALLWLMAYDWAHLRVREPTFYGQPYGVTFEAIPTALLHAIGIPYQIALPGALMMMALAAWWCLAFAAWHRKLWIAALLAAAAPLLLNIDHWVVVSVIGTSAGRLLAAICAAVCLAAEPSPRNLSIAVALGGLAVLFDSAAAPLAVPALVWALLPWTFRRRYWLPVLLGLLAPAAWYTFNVWFESAHPEHALHPSWGYNPELGPLLENWANPDRLFATHALDAFRHGSLYVVLMLCFLVAAAAARDWRALAAVSCLIALYAVLASMPKSLDGRASLWFPSARMTIAAPMAFWFAGCVTLQAVAGRARTALSSDRMMLCSVGGALLIVLASVGTAFARASNWAPRLDSILQAGLRDGGLPLRPTKEIYKLCNDVADVARAGGSTIVVFPTDRAANYACRVLHPELTTVFPGYERRAWVLRRLSSRPAERMLVWWGFESNDCNKKRFRRMLKSCAIVGDGRAMQVEFEPRPPLDVLREIGVRPRPFGPGCHPNEVATCGWWAARYGG